MSTERRGPATRRLYQVFGAYKAGRHFCDLCYSPEEIEQITTTPLAALPVEHGRKLLWETYSHWESADVYRHYLPRLLELLGPPWSIEDLYPLHLSETLIGLGFRRWPAEERAAVLEYLDDLCPALDLDPKDREDFAAGIAALRRPEAALPAGSDGDAGDA